MENQNDVIPALPLEVPLEMPLQDLGRWDGTIGAPEYSARRTKALSCRFAVFGGMTLLTAYCGWQMYLVVSAGGITLLEWALLACFIVNFSWIALSFCSAFLGFFRMLWRRTHAVATVQSLRGRTAILVPVYNEPPPRVFAGVEAMVEEIKRTGFHGSFEFFIISDTTDPDLWIAEEAAYLALRRRLGSEVKVWYRHRPINTNRKTGNVADWVTRWGGAYDYMLALDADSLMTGEAMVRLAAEMDADDNAGLIQTLPVIVNRNTLFARSMQFAARIYGPVIAEGLAAWMGREGNFWGHNAIIRTRAFAAHCGLPALRGRPPFGGQILSHDFVEAALMRRAGYGVYLRPDITGSYEESPSTVIDVAVRDRRWCQGNLQHIRVIGAKGFTLASRQHFATGIFGYLASPLWLLQLLIGITISLQALFIRPEYFTSEFPLLTAWPVFDAERALSLFFLTMAVLLTPKLLGMIVVMAERSERRSAGGAARLLASTLTEVVVSALVAPMMMIIQSHAVMDILLGRDSGWKPQRRDDGTVPFLDIARQHRAHTWLGVTAGIIAFLISPFLFAWMSPTIVGLVLSVPLSWGTGLVAVGFWFKRRGLLVVPEEATPPAVLARANLLEHEYNELEASQPANGLARICSSPELWRAHLGMLPLPATRAKGAFDPNLIVALAKQEEAHSQREFISWLDARQRYASLRDAGLLDKIARLPQPSTDAESDEQASCEAFA